MTETTSGVGPSDTEGRTGIHIARPWGKGPPPDAIAPDADPNRTRQLLPAHLREELLEQLEQASPDSLPVESWHVLSELQEIADDPFEFDEALYVQEFLHHAATWAASHKQAPDDEALRLAFGEDAPIVAAIWPALACLKKDMEEEAVPSPDGRAAIFVLQAPNLAGHRAVEALARSRLRNKSAEAKGEIIAEVNTWLVSAPNRFARMLARRGASSVMSYAQKAIIRKIDDGKKVKIKNVSIQNNGQVHQDVEVTKRSKRRWKERGEDCSDENLGDIFQRGADRRSHHSNKGLTVPEAARACGRPEPTVRKGLIELESVYGPAPREGKYYRIDETWLNRLKDKLATMPSRSPDDEIQRERASIFGTD